MDRRAVQSWRRSFARRRETRSSSARSSACSPRKGRLDRRPDPVMAVERSTGRARGDRTASTGGSRRHGTEALVPRIPSLAASSGSTRSRASAVGRQRPTRTARRSCGRARGHLGGRNAAAPPLRPRAHPGRALREPSSRPADRSASTRRVKRSRISTSVDLDPHLAEIAHHFLGRGAGRGRREGRSLRPPRR